MVENFAGFWAFFEIGCYCMDGVAPLEEEIELLLKNTENLVDKSMSRYDNTNTN